MDSQHLLTCLVLQQFSFSRVSNTSKLININQCRVEKKFVISMASHYNPGSKKTYENYGELLNFLEKMQQSQLHCLFIWSSCKMFTDFECLCLPVMRTIIDFLARTEDYDFLIMVDSNLHVCFVGIVCWQDWITLQQPL